MRPEPPFARSLVAFGNAALGRQVPISALDAWVPHSGHVRAISFEEHGRPLGACDAWLASLGGAGGSAPRLMLDASQSIGCERVVVCADVPLSAWEQRWERIAGARQAPWFDARFSRAETPSVLPPRGRTVSDVGGSLERALEGLVRLSERVDLESWGGYFADVLAVARGTRSPAGPSPLPPTASAEARRLAHAAGLADVFGGAGSWNDFGLVDPTFESERRDLSAALHDAMHASLLATAHEGLALPR